MIISSLTKKKFPHSKGVSFIWKSLIYILLTPIGLNFFSQFNTLKKSGTH